VISGSADTTDAAMNSVPAATSIVHHVNLGTHPVTARR